MMFRSTFSLNVFLLRSVSLCSNLTQRYVARDQNLPVEVEVDSARGLEELQLYLGVLGGRLEHVLLGAVFQNELHGEGAVLAAPLLRPRELHVRYLTHPDVPLGALLRHRSSFRLLRFSDLLRALCPSGAVLNRAGKFSPHTTPSRAGPRLWLPRRRRSPRR